MASVSEVDAGTVVTVTVSALTTATSLKAAPTAALSMKLSGLAGSWIHGKLISYQVIFLFKERFNQRVRVRIKISKPRKNRKPIGEVVVVVNQRWQSEATDGRKGA